jgi:hypothetical protein
LAQLVEFLDDSLKIVRYSPHGFTRTPVSDSSVLTRHASIWFDQARPPVGQPPAVDSLTQSKALLSRDPDAVLLPATGISSQNRSFSTAVASPPDYES